MDATLSSVRASYPHGETELAIEEGPAHLLDRGGGGVIERIADGQARYYRLAIAPHDG